MSEQLSLLDQGQRAGFELDEVFEAYYRCRANKRRTANALAFELDLETNLVQLWHELNEGSYRPGRAVAFIVDKPVKREIFAADFRDRIVHHLIIDKLNPLFEAEFIHDSYACRAGKGTLYGIRRLQRFIRSCSNTYTRDAYILQLDISGFFMHINHALLDERLGGLINDRYTSPDRDLLADLCRTVVFNPVRDNCVIKGQRADWQGLPAGKSLFGSPPGCGLPIGNLTSQVFANFYLNTFDHYVKHNLGIRFYGRYVDDMVVVHHDRNHLISLIPTLRAYLADTLRLTLHPGKIRLRDYRQGVAWLGAFIKPGRVYAGKRTKGNFHDAITSHNAIVADHEPDRCEQEAFRASINSYLGYLSHYNTRRLRRATLSKQVAASWWRHAYVNGDIDKIVLNKRTSLYPPP